MWEKLKGKVVLVTGGGSVISRATCLLLAQEGATIVAADIVEETGKRNSHHDGGKGRTDNICEGRYRIEQAVSKKAEQ